MCQSDGPVSKVNYVHGLSNLLLVLDTAILHFPPI